MDHLISSILNQIRHERNGYDIASSVVKGCVDIFLSLQADHTVTVYKQRLEPQILEHSLAFYNQEGEHLLNTCDAAEFLKRVSLTFVSSCRCRIFLGGKSLPRGGPKSTSLSIESDCASPPSDPEGQLAYAIPSKRYFED